MSDTGNQKKTLATLLRARTAAFRFYTRITPSLSRAMATAPVSAPRALYPCVVLLQ